MKRTTIFLFACLLGSATIFAQPVLWPRLGASMSAVGLSDELKEFIGDPKSSFGPVVGVGVEFPILGDILSVQPELLFHQRGTKLTFEGDGSSFEQNVRLNYLELPVLVKAKFGGIYVYAGPSVAYGIGGSYKSKMSYQGQSFEESGNVKFGTPPDGYEGDDLYLDNALDVNANGGAGIKLGPVVIDLRYVLGLSNLQDVEEGFTGDWKIKNRSFVASVLVPIPLGR